jgi:hypothetical protein
MQSRSGWPQVLHHSPLMCCLQGLQAYFGANVHVMHTFEFFGGNDFGDHRVRIDPIQVGVKPE